MNYPPIAKLIDERHSPAARTFNLTARRLELALGIAAQRMANDRAFIEAMKYRPLTRPEARVAAFHD